MARRSAIQLGLAALALLLPGVGCSSDAGDGGSAEPQPLPARPIPFPEGPTARGLSNPEELALSADGRFVLVLERGAGRVARLDREAPDDAHLERVAAPRGAFVGMQALPGEDAVLLLESDEPEVELFRPNLGTVEKARIHRLAMDTLELTLVAEDFSGSGFQVDPTGERILFYADFGLHWFSLRDGSISRIFPLPDDPQQELTCPVFAPEALDASGRYAFRNLREFGSVNTGEYFDFLRCDLETGEAISIPQRAEIEPLSAACGLVLRGAQRAGPERGVLFLAYDPASGAELRRFTANPPVELGGALGPATADADCETLWFTSPTGLHRHDVASGLTETVIAGSGRLGAIAVEDRTGRVLVTGAQNQAFTPRVVDLESGALTPYTASLRLSSPPPVGLTSWRGELLLLSFETYVRDLRVRDPYFTRLDRYDPATDTVTESDTERLIVFDIDSCGDGEVYAAGASYVRSTPGLEGVVAGGALLRVRPERFEPFEPLDLPPGAPASASELELSSDCRVAYLLSGGEVWRYDLSRRRAARLPIGGSALALDASDELLYVAGEGTLRALRLASGEVVPVATGLPEVTRMAVTPERQVLLIGDGGIGIGLVDLDGERATRLTEGYGEIGRWYRDRYQL